MIFCVKLLFILLYNLKQCNSSIHHGWMDGNAILDFIHSFINSFQKQMYFVLLVKPMLGHFFSAVLHCASNWSKVHGSGWTRQSWTTQIGLKMSLRMSMGRSVPLMGSGRQVADGTTGLTSVKHPEVRQSNSDSGKKKNLAKILIYHCWLY